MSNMALKEAYTQATEFFDRVMESVKLSGPMQNKFLETIIGLAKDLDSTFLIANARLKTHYPIIYCSDAFSEDTGFPRYEVTRHDVFLEFLYGRQTSAKSVKDYKEAVQNIRSVQVEMLLYSSKGIKHWFLVSLFPVKKDSDGTVGFFLMLFNNITHLKPQVKESPKRYWKRAVKKILNKPSIEQMRQTIEVGKQKKTKKFDMETIKYKIQNCFIPEYGGEIFQVPSFIIKHFHWAKLMWDIIIILLIIYTSIALPFIMSFKIENAHMTYFDVAIDIFFIFDIILNFFTTFVDKKGEIVTSPKEIRIHYIRGWFAVDCVAAIPYLTYFLIKQIMQVEKTIKPMIILKLARLLRMTKVRRKMHAVMQMSSVTLLVWISAFIIVGHWMACIWFVIGRHVDNPCIDKHGWLSVLADLTSRPYTCNNGTLVEGTGPDNWSVYVSALYYTLSSLTTCGFGNIAPNTSCEKVFGCASMLCGCVLYAFIFGQVTNIISQMQKNSNEFKDQLDDIKSFNDIYKVPHNVGKRLEDYFRSTWAVTKGTDEEEILKICPRDLQSDLCLHIHSRIFESNKGFKKLSQTSLRAISRYLCTIRTASGDKVVYQGEYVDTIYFVATGALEVKNGGCIMGLIGPGDAFGQRLGYLEHYGKSLFDVEACSFGTIHCITREHLREALCLFPEEYEKIRYGLVLSLDITRQIRIRKKTSISNDPKDFNGSNSPQMEKDMNSYQVDIRKPPNIYTHSDGRTELDYHENTSDVLTGMSELKGELRRETERMNAKMGVVEAQMRLVLKLLRSQHRINEVDPEIGLRLNELMTSEQTIDECNVEWSVADASGWKIDRYKQFYAKDNEVYDDSDHELKGCRDDSVGSESEIDMGRNFNSKSKLKDNMEVDDAFEETFKSTMNL